MGLKSTTRRLMTFASQDPWRAIEKSKYANKETAYWLVDQVDEAIYESNIDQALLLSFLLRRIAEKVGDPHVHCRASAVMGSAYRLASLYSLANRMLRQAEKYAADCPECRGEVCRRWGVVLHYEHQHEAALAKLESN